jgi:hypothetical protein
MDKPFTSKHCTPLNMGTPLHQAEISTTQPQGELVDIDSIVPGMQEYKAHQANMPQYVPGSSIGDKFNTTMKRIVHNLTGPKNPNLVGGTLPVGGAGRSGVIKGLGKLVAKGIAKYNKK